MPSGFYFIIPTLLVIFLSVLVVRAAALALMLTGLDERRARFQALSAFTGTGFTTREAESVVNHPERRRIISALMLLGNAGIVTVIIAATSTIVKSEGYLISINFLILLIGTYVIYRIATYRGFMSRWEKFISSHLLRFISMRESSIEELFEFRGEWGIVQAAIKSSSPFAGQLLSDCHFDKDGSLVLGIERGKKWISLPKPEETLFTGDTVVVYGPLDTLKERFN
jgi:hypothetical protein